MAGSEGGRAPVYVALNPKPSSQLMGKVAELQVTGCAMVALGPEALTLMVTEVAAHSEQCQGFGMGLGCRDGPEELSTVLRGSSLGWRLRVAQVS